MESRVILHRWRIQPHCFSRDRLSVETCLFALDSGVAADNPSCQCTIVLALHLTGLGAFSVMHSVS